MAEVDVDMPVVPGMQETEEVEPQEPVSKAPRTERLTLSFFL